MRINYGVYKCPVCDRKLCYDDYHFESLTAICTACRFKAEVIKLKDLENSYNHFKNTIMKNLSKSFTRTSYIPKPFIYRCFFGMNDGIGFNSEEVEKILICVKHYFNYISRHYPKKFSIPYEMLLFNTIEFLEINKRFELKIKRILPLWEEFTLFFQARCEYLNKKFEALN